MNEVIQILESEIAYSLELIPKLETEVLERQEKLKRERARVDALKAAIEAIR